MSVHAFFAYLFSSLPFFSFLSHLSFCNPSIGVLEAGSVVTAIGDISAAMIMRAVTMEIGHSPIERKGKEPVSKIGFNGV